jgi:hypothetical protein
MLTFESVDQAALVRRLLSGVPECDIVEPQAADIALAVVDRWGHNTPLDNSDLWKIPTNFPSDTSLLPSNRSLPLSTPKKLLDRLSPYPVSGGPSLNGLAAALPDQSAGDCARPKNRRKRGSEKKKSGGHQQALRNRFGMKFWDLLKVITGEQITSCTPAQQQYILEKKSERVIRPRPFVI